MSHDEKADAADASNANLIRGGSVAEHGQADGIYRVECYGADGTLKWSDTIENTVVTVGKNLALDTYLAGSAYTVVGPFMGLVSSVSFTAIAAGDTMTSHTGWTEAGGTNAPTYTAPRKTTNAGWSAASGGSKALTTALSFAITGTGTVKGAFLVFGSGAVSTIDNTAGTLYSAGLFTGGDRAVINGDTLNVSYTASL